MTNRIIKWIIFTVLFAFIPISVSLLLTYLTGSIKTMSDYNAEVLFFTIMISSKSLSDVVELNRRVKDFVLTLFVGFFVLLVLSSSIMYGSLLYGDIDQNVPSLLKERVFLVSGVLAIISGLLGTTIQVLLSRTEVRV